MEEWLSKILFPAQQILSFNFNKSSNNNPFSRRIQNRRNSTSNDYGEDSKGSNTQGLVEKPYTVLSLEDENHGNGHGRRGSRDPGVPAPITRAAVSIRILLIIISISLFSLFYMNALAGGDIEWVKSNLSLLSLNLILSILCLTVALTLVTITPMSSVFAGLLYLGVAVILLAHKKWDEGESFEAHGAYNMLVFLVIAVPLNVLLQLIILCQRRMNQKTFCRLMVMHVVAASILIVLLLMYYRSIWGNGSHGAHLKHGQFAGTELCEWDGVNLPFVDLLPNHSQKFWAGSSTCPQVTGIKAEWGHDGILTIQCLNKDKNLQPTYDILPDTKEWPTQEKIMHTYNKKIIERIEKRPYREPVLINDSGIEAIVANCEENISKVLIRVTSQEKVLDRVEAVQRARTKQKQDLISTVEQRALANSSQEEGLVNSKAVKYTKEEGERKPNVLVLFLDAVARRQFYRKLTKTAAVISDLTASTDEDSAQGRPQLHEFFRYHAVGLNTGANSRAIYTNHTEALVPVALPIWKVFHDAGYITSNVENSCYDWSTHYTGLTTSQYFDHELHTPFCLPPYFALTGNPFGNFVGPYSIVRRCLHGDNIHNHAFEYMTQFMQAYPDKPWFQLASFIEGHEGTGEVLLTVDHDLAKFIRGKAMNASN